MIAIGKTFAVIALGLSALVLTPIASQAQGASVIEQCQEQVKRIWPQNNLEYQRTEHDLVRACVQNGAKPNQVATRQNVWQRWPASTRMVR